MAARRVKMDRLVELVRLHRLGTKTREVARLLQMSPNTERKYRQALAAVGLLEGAADDLPDAATLRRAVEEHAPRKEPPKHERSKLEPWRATVDGYIRDGLRIREIHRRLRKNPEFEGSYAQVKRLVRALKKDAGPSADEVVIPVVTDPGDVVQVDFGYVGKLLDPITMTLRKTWVFVGVLGYSRRMWAKLVFDQRVETWVQLHVEMFDALGGVPHTAVPDNLKAAVIRAAFTAIDETSLNRSYRELARHYGFKIDPTPPRDPGKKGKVESGVKYLKNSVLKAREGEDFEDVQRELHEFIDEVANVRIHGTTGQPPMERFEAERVHLLPLPPLRYSPVLWREAKVHQDCHVQFRNRRYSAPWTLVGQTVWLRVSATDVSVYANDERVATHVRQDGGGEPVTNDAHLPDKRSEYRHRTRAYWQDRADALGEDIGALIQEVFERDDVLCQLRPVQAIVTYLSGFPPHRATNAAKRALFYGVHDYRGIKRILVNGLDLQPLPHSTPVVGSLTAPRFARSLEEIEFAPPMGGAHGSN